MELAGRKDVPEELTWDLSLIYPTEADWQADFDAAAALAERIGREFRGRLDDPERIVACLDLYEQLEQKFSLVLHYADLAVSVDYYDTASQ